MFGVCCSRVTVSFICLSIHLERSVQVLWLPTQRSVAVNYFTGERHATDHVQAVPEKQREMMMDLLHGVSKIEK